MRIEPMTFVGSVMLSAMALACGADHGALEGATPDALAEEESLAPHEASSAEPEDVEALRAGVITAEENERLAGHFERTGRAPTAIEGRILHWDDAWSTVGDVLSLAELERDAALTEKAYVETTNYNPSTSSSFQFFRPDIGRPIWIIVPNNLPTAVFNALTEVVAEYPALIGSDCLFPSVPIVRRRSDYDALSTAMKEESFETEFRYIPRTDASWTCKTGDNACMRFPGFQNVFVYLDSTTRVQRSRLAIGSLLQVDSGTFPTTDIPKLKRVLRHELGHGFGFDHPQVAATTHQLPGTASCGQCTSPLDSVMKQGGRDSFTADDIKAFRTLYSDEPNRSNDGCSYVDGFRNLTALP